MYHAIWETFFKKYFYSSKIQLTGRPAFLFAKSANGMQWCVQVTFYQLMRANCKIFRSFMSDLLNHW